MMKNNLTLRNDYIPSKNSLKVSIPFINHRTRMAIITFCSDLGSFILSMLFVFGIVYRNANSIVMNLGRIEYYLFVVICFSLFMTTKLYPGIGLNPALEIKIVTQLTTISFLIVFSFSLIKSPSWLYSNWIFVLFYITSIILTLSMRWIGRILATQLHLWGVPVVVVGRKNKIESLINYFSARCRLGLSPMAGVTEHIEDSFSNKINILSIDDFFNYPTDYFSKIGINTVLFDYKFNSAIGDIRKISDRFENVIFISDMDLLEEASITFHDLEGMMGMEINRSYLSSLDVIFKRVMDILLALMLGIVSLPIFLITSILIRFDTPGPIFYTQKRLGKYGHKINVYKFRSMQVNADEILVQYLKNNPSALLEWEQKQKLCADPRITRVGKWIRKLSIDEMPQLFNVLKGEMSLVGPRPILIEQEKLYGEGIKIYKTVNPGITGFWQVSGRNHTSFSQRSFFDVYYVRNWSVWLDIYILLRTIWVVISSEGAY